MSARGLIGDFIAAFVLVTMPVWLSVTLPLFIALLGGAL